MVLAFFRLHEAIAIFQGPGQVKLTLGAVSLTVELRRSSALSRHMQRKCGSALEKLTHPQSETAAVYVAARTLTNAVSRSQTAVYTHQI